MHIFKASAETYDSVISNQKHAFANSPKDISPGDIIILSKNKSGLRQGEKQIAHYAILKKIRACTDEEIETLWPGNPGRWKFITEFSEVRQIEPTFNLEEVLSAERTKHYSYLMTHGKISIEDESVIQGRINRKIVSYFPEELEKSTKLFEGGVREITVNAYERDPRARDECLKSHGFVCKICDFSFAKVYGELGKNYIHVHHITPLFLRQGQYQVDPITDLIPVCPNCHAMLHRSNPPMSPQELKEIYLERKN